MDEFRTLIVAFVGGMNRCVIHNAPIFGDISLLEFLLAFAGIAFISIVLSIRFRR